jgi:hypothetical protein
MVIALAIAVAVALAAVVAAVVVVVRARRTAETRVQQLAAGLGYTSELSASLDPGDVIDRTLDAVVALPGVDAALLAVGENGDAARMTRAAGMTADEVERTLLQMPAHPDLRAIEVVYRYRLDDVNESSKLPRSALTVSLRAEGETIGSLAAVTRSTTGGFSESAESALEGLARRAGPAIWNAIRFTEAREQAELDSLTGLHNRRSSTSSSAARSHVPSGTSATSHSSSSTSTTSSGSTTGSAISAATVCSPRSRIASAASFAPPTSRAGSAATSSP